MSPNAALYLQGMLQSAEWSVKDYMKPNKSTDESSSDSLG
jgi:hypothetical protein